MLDTTIPSTRHAVACDTTNHTFEQISDMDALKRAADDDSVHVWLDLGAPTAEEMARVAERLKLHPLAVDDAMNGHQRPKIEEYDDFFFIVFYALRPSENGKDIQPQEVRMFVAPRYLVTVHDDPIPALEEAERRWTRNAQQAELGVGILLYSLLDSVVDQYFPIIDGLVDRAEALDDRIFTGAIRDAAFTYELLELKRTFLELRRIVGPERDVLNVLTNRDSPVFHEHTIVYYRDVYDHLSRVSDTIDLYRDQLTSSMDASLAIASNDLNKVMRTLTAMSIILMSVTLIASIYGMNFEIIPELHWRFGYLYALALMAVVSYGLWRYFKHLNWF